jgi:hypothetical protein
MSMGETEVKPIGGASEGVSGGVVNDAKDEKKFAFGEFAGSLSVRLRLDIPRFFLTVFWPGMAGGLGVTCILR